MKIFVKIVLCCFLFLGVLEISACLYNFSKYKKFLTPISKKIELQISNPNQDSIQTKMAIHPYLGALTKENLRFSENNPLEFYQKRVRGINYIPSYFKTLKVNNHGFWMPFNLPFEKKTHEKVIGIFGGSVAYHFALSAIDEKTKVFKKLIQQNNENGFETVFLNFASGGLKQPQQMLALAYFLSIGQKFDAVINIDGFNEVYVSWINTELSRIDSSMPCGQFLYGIMNSSFFNILRENQVSSLSIRTAQMFNKLDSYGISATIRAVSNVLNTNVNLKIKSISQELSQNQGLKNMQYPIQVIKTEKSFLESIPGIVEVWSTSSLIMHNLCLQNDILYIHCLQPNQYYRTSRSFTEQELKEYNVLGADSVPLAKIVPQVYHEMKNQSVKLVKSGVKFVDGTLALDKNPNTVYIDWACHLNDHGNESLNLFLEPVVCRQMKYGTKK